MGMMSTGSWLTVAAVVALCCVAVLCSGAAPELTGTGAGMRTQKLTLAMAPYQGGSRKPQQQLALGAGQRQRRDGTCVATQAHAPPGHGVCCAVGIAGSVVV